MGPWFVIGYTPIVVDKEAHNAVEHYYLDEKNRIQTTYQFRKGSYTGELKTYTPVGNVYNTETNAEWRMQFIWPFKAAYVILYLSKDYSTTVVVHPNRKYAWIMHRQPEMAEQEYQGMLDRLEAEGYDREIIRRLPQDWTSDAERLEAIKSLGSSKPLASLELE